MILTLFISEDKRDEFAGTAWPFDSLLEHRNQGALAQTDVGLSPEPRPSQPGPARPRGSGSGCTCWEGSAPVPGGGLARRELSPEPPAGEQSREAPASPHLGSFTVRSTLRSWEASWEPGAPALSPASCFTGAGGNLAGEACCPFPTGEGREEGVRGAEGCLWAPTGTPRRAGSVPGGLGPPGALAAGQRFSPLT